MVGLQGLKNTIPTDHLVTHNTITAGDFLYTNPDGYVAGFDHKVSDYWNTSGPFWVTRESQVTPWDKETTLDKMVRPATIGRSAFSVSTEIQAFLNGYDCGNDTVVRGLAFAIKAYISKMRPGDEKDKLWREVRGILNRSLISNED